MRRRSSNCRTEANLTKYGSAELSAGDILEVSTPSEDYETGKTSSVLNLMCEEPINDRVFCVENWFQSAKVFARDGQGVLPLQGTPHGEDPKALPERIPRHCLLVEDGRIIRPFVSLEGESHKEEFLVELLA